MSLKKELYIVGVCLAGIVILWAGWQAYSATSQVPISPTCSQEGKVCADGTVVGRTGPHCEFAECPVSFTDYKNGTYEIMGIKVALVDGRAETDSIPSSASKTVTQYFGNNAKGDLDGDSIPDLAFLLTQNGGGSGTFYYVVAALQLAQGSYLGTNAILLGDRVAPQTTEIKNGQLIVNYAVRKEGEPMSAAPAVGISKYLHVVDGQLVEVPE